jgi:hypothetical protein
VPTATVVAPTGPTPPVASAPPPGRANDPTFVPTAAPGGSLPPTPAPTSSGRGPLIAVLAVLVVALVGIVGAVALVGGDDDDVSAEADGFTDDGFTDDEFTGDGLPPEELEAAAAPSTSRVPTTTRPPSTTTMVRRTATLHAGEAVIREAPDLYSRELARFRDREGMSFEVLEEADADGWYRVRIDGTEGYLFGAFVLPPTRGYCVATGRGGAPRYYDEFDGTITEETSGNRVLITSPGATGDVPVVLPGGRRGYVWSGDIDVVAC